MTCLIAGLILAGDLDLTPIFALQKHAKQLLYLKKVHYSKYSCKLGWLSSFFIRYIEADYYI